MAELWAPFATRRPGPRNKGGYSFAGFTAPKRGSVDHSAEGYSRDVIHDILDGPRRACWHFTIGYGWVEQHYPLDWNCWHAGDADDDNGVVANVELIGKEHMGMVGDRLSAYQLDMSVRIDQWAADQMGTEGFARWPDQSFPVWTLCEHNEVSDTPTSCPSGRIPWNAKLALLNPPPQEDEDMKPFLAWDLERRRVYLIGPWGASWITKADDVERFKAKYGDELTALHSSTIDAF